MEPNTPVPSRCNKPPRGRIVYPNWKQNPSIKVETWDPVSTSAIVSTPTTTTVTLLEWPISHTKGLGLWYPCPEGDFPRLNCILDSPLLCCMLGAGWRCLWPLFLFKECLDAPGQGVPIHHIGNILPYCGDAFCNDFEHYHFSLYSHFYICSFCYPAV